MFLWSKFSKWIVFLIIKTSVQREILGLNKQKLMKLIAFDECCFIARMRARTHTHTQTYMHTHTRIHTHACTHRYTDTDRQTDRQTDTHTHTHTHTHALAHVTKILS